MMSNESDRLRARIAALSAKTIANGCTEAEALAAAAKVAELLDRHALTMSDVEIRASPCIEASFETARKKRVPLDGCVGAVAAFCGCRVWREKGHHGHRFVFFGLPEQAEAARDLVAMIDGAVRTELGRYKTSAAYTDFDHRERHLVNASFVLGMVEGIADKLDRLTGEREARTAGTGRDLAIVKNSVVDEAIAALGLVERDVPAPRRFIAPAAYDAGGTAGEGLAVGRR